MGFRRPRPSKEQSANARCNVDKTLKTSGRVEETSHERPLTRKFRGGKFTEKGSRLVFAQGWQRGQALGGVR